MSRCNQGATKWRNEKLHSNLIVYMQVDGHQAGKDIHQFALSFTTFKVHLIFAFSDEVKEHMPHTRWDIVVGVAPSWYIESTSQHERNRCSH